MRNVIVTGGSRGLGLAMARELARSGYRAIAAARKTSSELSAAMSETSGGQAGALSFVPTDLSKTEEIPDFVRCVREEFGEIYGLVNNAGIGTHGVLASMHVSKIRELVELNTLSPIVLSKFVLRSMMVAGTGRIINVSSIASFTGYSGLAVYAATKASLIGFTRSLAREAGRIGVTVNAIAPGFVETEMTGAMSEADKMRIAHRSALQRLAEPEDIADTVKFLMGESGRNITGTVIIIDAGNSA